MADFQLNTITKVGKFAHLCDCIILIVSNLHCTPKSRSESVCKEQELVFDGIHPIYPVVDARAGGELVWNCLCKKFLMKIAVDLIEEIFRTAVDCDIQSPRLEKVSHVDDGVLCPSLRKFLLGAKSL